LILNVKDFKPLIAVTSTEPLLYGELFSFIDFVKQNNLKLQLTTNGFLLPQNAQKIIDSGIDSLWVSIDGTESVHNYIRGSDKSFANAVNGLKKVYLSRQNSVKDTPELNINYSISNYNYFDLNNFVEYLENLGDLKINILNFSHLNFVTNEMADKHNKLFGGKYPATPSSVTDADPLKVDAGKVYNEIEKIKSRKLKNILKINFIPEFNQATAAENYYYNHQILINKRKCDAAWTTAQITANGDCVVLTRCFHAILGNINDEQFTDIWNGKKYNEFRKFIDEVKLTPACARCCAVL